MRPGFGSNALHLGQTEQEVQSFLGTRESLTRKFPGQYFYNYPSKGIEVDFGCRGGLAAHLYFFRKGFRENSGSRMRTIGNIAPGETRQRVLAVFGKPQRESEALPFLHGRMIDAWSHYDIGINFQFGDDNRVNMITITHPES